MLLPGSKRFKTLGLLTAYKTDLTCITAEMVHETALRLPVDCFGTSDTEQVFDAVDHFARLSDVPKRIYPCPTRTEPSRKAFVVAKQLQFTGALFAALL